ncbi:MAG: hypothetical protein IT326_04755 [Anaerolineae bacterium]|nr:hypothetical protein [Anaerolineae bacterium]
MAEKARKRYEIHQTTAPGLDHLMPEEARLAWVELLDRFTSDLAAPAITLDGQAVVLEDYLEVHPHWRSQVEELVAGGRLFPGPWYVQTAQHLVSGEALIRNLQEGLLLSRKLGAVGFIASLTEGAVQLAQLPQILDGFGLYSAFLQPGMQSGGLLQAGAWVARDGAQIALFREANARGHGPELRVNDYRPGGVPVKRRPVRRTVSTLTGLAELIRDTASLPYPEVLPVVDRTHPESSGTLSARLWIKQRNHRIQTLLENWAEPFTVWASLLSPSNPKGFLSASDVLSYAWRLALRAQTPEVLLGCASDATYRMTQSLHERAETVADAITRGALETLAAQINTTTLPAKGVAVVVFNAARSAQSGPVSVALAELPWDPLLPMEMTESAGRSVPCSVVDVEQDGDTPRLPVVEFIARDVPAFGYDTFVISQTDTDTDSSMVDVDSGLSIENEALSLTVDRQTGLLTIFDKRTGRSYAGLGRFEDGGDCGTVLSYAPPTRDTIIDVPANAPLLVTRQRGATSEILYVFQIFRLPESLSPDRSARLPMAAQFVPMAIATRITLYRSVPRVELDIRLANEASNHRLRIHFPSGLFSETVFADGLFTVNETVVSLAQEGADPEPVAVAQRAFTTIISADSGLTIASRGLPEAWVTPAEHGHDVAVTLLRAVGEPCALNGIERARDSVSGAQGFGEHELSLAVIPHPGTDWLSAWHQSWQFQTPLRALVTTRHKGVLNSRGSLVTVDNPLVVLSTIKPARDGQAMIVRVYNLSGEAQSANVQIGVSFGSAERMRLDEASLGLPPLQVEGQTVTLTVPPFGLQTIALLP